MATVTTPLLGLIDTAFTGHMGGAAYLAAIALGGNIFNLTYWLFGFLRGGTSGFTAQARGAGDVHGQAVALMRSLTLALAVGVGIIVLQRPLEWLFRAAMDPSDERVWQLAVGYFRILVWGAPAVLSTYALLGWFIGMGRTRAAMWMSIAIDVVNIVVTGILVLGVGFKVEGVAFGTLAAQWSGPLVALPMVFRLLDGRLKVSLNELLDSGPLRRFLRVNLDIFLRTLCLIGVTLWFTRVGASQGAGVLAANALLMQFFLLFSYVMDGFAYAGESLMGQAAGARDVRRQRVLVKRIMRMGAWLAGLFTIVYFLAGNGIVSLLSDSEEVRGVASDYMYWVVAIPIVSFAAFAWDGMLVGNSETRPLLHAIVVATVVYFGVWFSLGPLLGNHAIWLAFLCYLGCRAVLPGVFRQVDKRFG